jgi:hypothetical protein
LALAVFKMSTSEILKDLQSLNFTGNYLSELDLLAERLEEEDLEGEAIEPVLRFLEAHRDEDLGMPGPLVHYVERYFRRGYESKLLESLQRSPTPRTVWMLNRLLNGVKGAEKEPYLLEMKRLAKADDSEVAELAGQFERLHQE